MMKKMKFLAGLAMTGLLAPAALAQDTKEEEKPVHRNYISVGLDASANSLSEDGNKLSLGLEGRLRKQLSDHWGFSVGLSISNPFTESVNVKGKLNLHLNSTSGVAEYVLGIGVLSMNNKNYARPSIGVQFNLGEKDGMYILTEFGLLTRERTEGVFLEFGLGYRFEGLFD